MSSGLAKRRAWSNRLAGLMISLGGGGVIAVVVAIFIFIGYETLPLWIPTSSTTIQNLDLSGSGVLAVGLNEYRTAGYAITRTADIVFFDPATAKEFHSEKLASEGTILRYARFDHGQNAILLCDSKGTALIKTISIRYAEKSHIFSSAVVSDFATFSLGDSLPIHLDFVNTGSDEFLILAAFESGRSRIFKVHSGQSLFGGSTPEVAESDLSPDVGTPLTAVAVDTYGDKAAVARSDGIVDYWDLRGDTPTLAQSVPVSKAGITALEFLLGAQTLVVGDERGEVSTWTWVLDTTSRSGLGLYPLNSFEGHSNPVTSIASATRNKSFLTGSSNGEVFLHYQTTGKTLVKRSVAPSNVQEVSFSPRGDGVIVLTGSGLVVLDSLFSPHPEVSLKTLFSKVQYEGYRQPTYTWQSTGGTDDFESKFSLMPLLFGTVKGAAYALIFALPMAILGALYTALFAHPGIRNLIKPTVEIMAALPSVVIGFIAALWLAPILERHFVSVVLVLLAFPFSVIAAVGVRSILPRALSARFPHGSEIIFLIPALLGIMYLSSLTAPWLETSLFGGSFRQWLYESVNVTYDQRNSLVVGFAMGFAVIPVIFTISEDALSGVPQHLTAGSLALGATRWQTATRVVLPTASPGIFSAAMVGFGRAVGETMIVLMATGNTPVMDFSAFVGMRTLSANIAVEIPEAPYLSTLYRILFLSGLLLFAFTFAVNTLAEVIRQRLRKRFSTI